MSRLRLLRPVRIADERSGGSNEVLTAFFKLLLSLFRSSDDIGRYDRYAHGLLDGLCQIFTPARLVCSRLEPAVICIIVCTGYIDGIHAKFFKSFGDPLSFLKTIALARLSYPVHHLVYGQTDHQRVVLSAALLDTGDDLLQKPHAVLEAASVLIFSVICIRRQELLDQIPVSSVELNNVYSGLLASLSRVDEILLELVDLPPAHRVHDSRSVRGFRSPGRSLHRKTDPLSLQPEKQWCALVHEVHELRHPLGDRDHYRERIEGASVALSARMMQLDSELGSMTVELSDHLAHRLDVIIMAHRKLRVSRRACHVIDSAYTRDNETDSPFGPLLVVIRESRCYLAARLP